MPKRYEALRGGGGGGVTSALRNVICLANTAWFPLVRRGFQNNVASISNNMFLCIMFTIKTGSHINNYP